MRTTEEKQLGPMVVVNIHRNAVEKSMAKRGIQSLEEHRKLVVKKIVENAERFVDHSVNEAGKYMEERN